MFALSRFVYTKLLAVLGKARRPLEALQAFNLMRVFPSFYCWLLLEYTHMMWLERVLTLCDVFRGMSIFTLI